MVASSASLSSTYRDASQPIPHPRRGRPMSSLNLQLLAIGLVAGFSGGMFGIGGGAIMVPAMVLLMGLDQKLATGTSIAAQILPLGLLGAA
ncbi:MAG: TSUP family transporter, partial [Deltaproteobacteria bacterium]|nr:TSUP family transporter [Deltaproteobacteria bacterium]